MVEADQRWTGGSEAATVFPSDLAEPYPARDWPPISSAEERSCEAGKQMLIVQIKA
jgi:hypothetical protein